MNRMDIPVESPSRAFTSTHDDMMAFNELLEEPPLPSESAAVVQVPQQVRQVQSLSLPGPSQSTSTSNISGPSTSQQVFAKSRLSGRVIKNAQYYRDPKGISKTVTYPVDEHSARVLLQPPPPSKQKELEQMYMDETSRAANAMALDVAEGEAEAAAEDMRDIPSTSANPPGLGNGPLRRLSLQIGNKVLNFRVVDVPVPEQEWRDELPVTEGVGAGRTFMCPNCGKHCGNMQQLRDHRAQVHGVVSPFRCSYCFKNFASRASLNTHMFKHTGEKPFQCELCLKTFSRGTNFQLHMKLHASGRRHFCSMCGKWFREETEMLEHQTQCYARMQGELISTDRPLRYQCNYCEKMFHHKRDKHIHERTHTGERPYTCGYCGRGFTQSQALTIHIRVHTGERPYQCAHCGKTFRDSSALRKHEFVKHPGMMMSTSPNRTGAVVVEEGGGAGGGGQGAAGGSGGGGSMGGVPSGISVGGYDMMEYS